MFENQYNEEMELEVKRLEAKKRATDSGHPEWVNACAVCKCKLDSFSNQLCDSCSKSP
jgi:hypothetical protein